MDSTNSFGNYLKARRRLVTPEQAGIPRGSRRRVAGLRREEVALLATISPEYYLRLEQGRDHNPSASVLDSLAAVLQLDAEAAAYLHRLARSAPTDRRGIQATESAPPGVAQLIDELPLPAFVQGRWMDVLAANPLAEALSPHYRKGVNVLRAVFLDPEDRVLHQDWERATREAVSGLRASAGTDLDHPQLTELVDELSAASDRFRSLWERHDVRQKVGGVSLFLHPLVGQLELRHEKFLVTGRDNQILVIYHAEPGSPSQEALRRLASVSAEPT
ncbi:helix-turn-helix domain-containing protein [Nakamurella sp. GG22]